VNGLQPPDKPEPPEAGQPFTGHQPAGAPPPPPPPPAQPAAGPRPRRGGSLVGPLILIGLGTIFLLNTLGVASWDLWKVLARLWPVVLIAIGLELLIGRRSRAASLLVIVAAVAVLAGAAWYLSAHTAPGGQEVIGQALDGATRADVTIQPGVASLHVGGSAGAGRLIDGTVDRARGERLDRSSSRDGDTARFTLKSGGERSFPFFGLRYGGDNAWDLQLNPDLPTRLKVSTGVGQSTLDLQRLQLTGLDVNTGVGQTTITLPARGQFSANVDAGVGDVTVKIPVGMAARIRVQPGLGDSQLPSGYQRQGDWYVSPGYDTAQQRVDMEVHGGVGRLPVEQVGGR
jgi:hypothetical protein